MYVCTGGSIKSAINNPVWCHCVLHALHVSDHSVYDLYILLLVAMEAIAVKLFDKLLVLLSDKVHVSCIVAMVTRCN